MKEIINSTDSLIKRLTSLAIKKEYVFRGYNMPSFLERRM